MYGYLESFFASSDATFQYYVPILDGDPNFGGAYFITLL